MPKERVYGKQLLPDVPDDVPCSPEQPVAEVRWSRETGDVLIVTRELSSEMHGPADDPIPARYGYYVDLNRRAINDLIRVLRRARDQAFGRDE